MPIVTDFTRTTQPIVRYRLDDVLVASEQPCPCGSATMAIARIEGRQDDQLQLPTRSGDIQTVFADACSRVLAMTLPLTVDYRLLQTGSAQLTLIADCELWMLEHCREALNALFIRQDIAVGQLIWSLELQTVPVSLQPSGGALCVSGGGNEQFTATPETDAAGLGNCWGYLQL
ncbi:hypothetical protein MUTS16_40980 [Escherichia coli]|nr:hypothetical protein MUTS16_40980 [Escherichia coli]